MEKPFVFGVATSGDNFTDREKETQRLLLNFAHGVNTVLISPRRWGKTSLVKKVAQLSQDNKRKVVYIDIFSCRTENEFYRLFATSILKQTSSKWEEWIENTTHQSQNLYRSRSDERFLYIIRVQHAK